MSSDLGAVLEAWRRSDELGASAVLATVVHVRGSAYRRPGARMLILPDGSRIGSISGGCLEGDLVRKAWWSTEGGCPVVRIFDTSSEDDAVWEFGLGCNGIVHVLLERTGLAATRAVRAFIEECRGRSGGVLATVVAAGDSSAGDIGQRLFLDATGVRGGELAEAGLAAVIRSYAEAALGERTSRLLNLDDRDLALEYVAPAVRLVIFGAGHDAIPLVAMAKQLGWHVTVADGRPAYARPERFPGADAVVLLHRDEGLGPIAIGRESVVVLMTHNFFEDARLLEHLLPLEPRYLGLLGPADRADRLFAEIGTGARSSVHAPVGLDIGGDGPEAIALSIVAEVQAVLAGRAGGELRLRAGPTHEAIEEVGRDASLSWPPSEATVCEVARDV